LIGEDLAVSDLVDEFRYIYGKRIVVSDTALLKRKIDGRVFLKSEESIIYSIANILQANIRVKKIRFTLIRNSENTLSNRSWEIKTILEVLNGGDHRILKTGKFF